MKEKKIIPVIYPPGSMMRIEPQPILTDPFGSYTGRGEDPEEKPVQDADDL